MLTRSIQWHNLCKATLTSVLVASAARPSETSARTQQKVNPVSFSSQCIPEAAKSVTSGLIAYWGKEVRWVLEAFLEP